MNKACEYHEQALEAHKLGDRTKSKEFLDKRLSGLKDISEDLEKIKLDYLANKILPVESGAFTLGKTVKNEDAYFQDNLHSIYGVFDGVGGHEGGDIASQAAKDYLEKNSEVFSDMTSLEDIKNKMKDILVEAHEAIKEKPGSSTASVVKIMLDRTAVIGNIGDSRVYLLENGSQSVEHLTLDDSGFKAYTIGSPEEYDYKKIQEDMAQIDTFDFLPDNIPLFAARTRNGISQALGTREMEPNIYTHPLSPGDRLIIMSDGIHDNLTDQQIAKCLIDNPHDTEKAARALVQQAKEVSKQNTSRSKPDDITAIVVKL